MFSSSSSDRAWNGDDGKSRSSLLLTTISSAKSCTPSGEWTLLSGSLSSLSASPSSLVGLLPFTCGERGGPVLGVGDSSLSSGALVVFLEGDAVLALVAWAAEVVAAVPFTFDADRGDAVDGRTESRGPRAGDLGGAGDRFAGVLVCSDIFSSMMRKPRS
jgi:hypothetical protein